VVASRQGMSFPSDQITPSRSAIDIFNSPVTAGLAALGEF
jgi:hypothetical protein